MLLVGGEESVDLATGKQRINVVQQEIVTSHLRGVDV